jgi:signal transduction histidine kinase
MQSLGFSTTLSGAAAVVAADGEILAVTDALRAYSPRAEEGFPLRRFIDEVSTDEILRRARSNTPNSPFLLVRVVTPVRWEETEAVVLPEGSADAAGRVLLIFHPATENPLARRANERVDFLFSATHRYGNILPFLRSRVARVMHLVAGVPGVRELRETLDSALGDIDVLRSIVLEMKQYNSLAGFKLTSLDLANLVVARLADDLRARFRGHATIELDADAPIPIAYDHQMLLAAFMAFVENSVAFHERGRPTIRMTVGPYAQGVMIVYSDDGPGVSDKWKSLMWEPFKSTRDSTGLGMAIARKVIELHGGGVVENGQVGYGVHIEIRLPRALR